MKNHFLYGIAGVFLLTMVIACSPTKKDRMIEGQWSGVTWTVKGIPTGFDAATVGFTFRPDATYTYTYQGFEESGEYFVTGQELYTTPAGGEKIMVKIKSLTADTLKFEMNRGGQLELLTLARNK
jgi:hypothetical protein